MPLVELYGIPGYDMESEIRAAFSDIPELDIPKTEVTIILVQHYPQELFLESGCRLFFIKVSGLLEKKERTKQILKKLAEAITDRALKALVDCCYPEESVEVRVIISRSIEEECFLKKRNPQ